MSVVWSDPALSDLVTLYDFTAAVGSRKTAINYVASVEEAANALSDFPYSAPAREDLGVGIRAKVHRLAMIIYSVDAERTVLIERIVDQRQDYGSVFK
jgi:plasmid stabilization system protein ParE